ncbi:Hsp20/alpha crystallin family protein [Litoreibacter roseus]|uniref:Molecular chaperone Hsp20 n=1 Tax=Litoreibacter roseus TaxID=2601869 RepID=A0A6N6JGZ9_9RHOB|nr:Hsp20/alpha crystallin family protein [Litoreibacter roseus]GFE65496.1 molecular chaperone Hsp20 [Litoreibacter roseus]
MSRHTLPDLNTDADGPAFFPSFQKEMNRLLDQFRSGVPLPDMSARAMVAGSIFPAIDVVETDDAIEITAEVPGVKAEDLHASITGNLLTLKGEKSSDREERDDNYHLTERRYGNFRRQIPLGFSPDAGAVESAFADGILKLRIAKPAEAKAEVQKIDITKS